jgi:signal transduction histidine kinase
MGNLAPSPTAWSRRTRTRPAHERPNARQVPTPLTPSSTPVTPASTAPTGARWSARAGSIDLGARAVCLLTGFALAYLVFGTSTSSATSVLLVAGAIALLLAAFTRLPTPRSARADTVGPDHLETAIMFTDARAAATAAERERIAREIHDGIAQDVASLGYLVDELSSAQQDPAHHSGLADVRSGLEKILSGLRLTVADLRSAGADDNQLGPALTDYALAVGKRSSMVVHLAIKEAPQRLAPQVETELLRIAQEAVTNAANHASAGNLWVTATVDAPYATISIDDDGVGAAAPRRDHYGLHIMQERAERIGAVLAIDNRPEGGTRVRAVLEPRESPESQLQLGGSDAVQRPSHR